jgi:hypothetical protein
MLYKNLEALAREKLGFTPQFGGKQDIFEAWLRQKGVLDDVKEKAEETPVLTTREKMKAFLFGRGVSFAKNIPDDKLSQLFAKHGGGRAT